jgi:acetyl-CoA synthetase
MMLGYWNRPDATVEKFRDGWMLTGDRGQWEAGYLRFIGREDDVITSAGYRIGPSEIEDCLMRHPAVALAAVIGAPCPLRTEKVMAFVVLKDDQLASPALAAALTEHVGTTLAHHVVPRALRFVDSLPMTVTGKVIRKDLKAQVIAETAAAAAASGNSAA